MKSLNSKSMRKSTGYSLHMRNRFCHGKSCFTNLIKSYNDWTLAVDEGWKVDILYLDYRKSFDSVPHIHLLRKLKSYGITGKILT